MNFVDAKDFRLQMIKSYHPRYLETSLGYKEHIFGKLSPFYTFLCLFASRTTSIKKSEKIVKIAFFENFKFLHGVIIKEGQVTVTRLSLIVDKSKSRVLRVLKLDMITYNESWRDLT